jgi:hypothetical protein
MTTLGKIMSIFVFLLALAWFALTAIVFSTRAEWKKTYEKTLAEANKNAKDTEELKKQLLAERANIAARQQSADQAVAAISKERDELNKKYTELLATSNRVSDATALLLPTQKGYDGAIKKVLDQVDRLSTENVTLSTDRDQYAKSAQLASNKATDAELQKKVFSDALDSTREELRKALEAKQATQGLGAADSKFRGQITATTKDGIVQFSGGMNAGVNVGKTYKVTRTVKPYLIGVVVVTISNTKEAAGTFTPASPDKQLSGEFIPKVGDIVESN